VLRRSLVLTTALASCLATAGIAAAQQAPEAPPRATQKTITDVPPGAGELARVYNVPLQEAARRIGLQGRISNLVAQLQGGSDPEFAGVWIQHQPSFKVVIAYTHPTEAKLSALNIDPEVRSLIELRTLAKSRQAVLGEQDRIMALLPQSIPHVTFVEDETRGLSSGSRHKL